MTRPAPRPEAWGQHAPDLLIGVVFAALGFAEAWSNAEAYGFVDTLAGVFSRGVVLALVFAVAGGLYRKAPGLALLMVWLGGAFQVVTSTNLMLVQSSVVLVAYGTARFGSTAVLWASGLSIPLGGVITLAVIGVIASGGSAGIFRGRLGDLIVTMVGSLTRVGAVLSLAFLAFCLLALPWLSGLALRLRSQSEASRAARVDAEEARSRAVELAAVREEQAQLARDVHDVVGHSLAVILAQAESAQFLRDDRPEDLKHTLATIAHSARTSLGDVRNVLVSGTAAAPPSAGGDLDSLVEGVRASGHIVTSSVAGVPRPLPPELQLVAYRVLQEMLTNAIKHGRRDRPIQVERHWEDHLRIEVRNAVASAADRTDGKLHQLPTPTGLGLDGMRRRLESVGGRLDVSHQVSLEGEPIWTATGWVPIRAHEVELP